MLEQCRQQQVDLHVIIAHRQPLTHCKADTLAPLVRNQMEWSLQCVQCPLCAHISLKSKSHSLAPLPTDGRARTHLMINHHDSISSTHHSQYCCCLNDILCNEWSKTQLIVCVCASWFVGMLVAQVETPERCLLLACFACQEILLRTLGFSTCCR